LVFRAARADRTAARVRAHDNDRRRLLAAAALALSGAAAAQGYAVVSAGSSKVDLECGGTGLSCDESGTAFKLLGGYKFTPNFALEGGYVSFGEGTVSDGTTTIKLKTDAFVIGGALHADFSQSWNFVARLGLAQVKTKLSATGLGSDSESGAQAYAGFGIGYRLTKQLSLDAALDFTKVEVGGAKDDVRALSLGLTYAF
jgi:OmpA-OmpF porin, OOP family